jgi:hypothetical protein
VLCVLGGFVLVMNDDECGGDGWSSGEEGFIVLDRAKATVLGRELISLEV